MTAATLESPVCVPAPRGGTADMYVAPAPVVCDWCQGEAFEPFEELAAIPCLACDGCGVMPLDHDMPRSRTHEVRHIRYEPTCGLGSAGVLTVTTAVKAGRKASSERYQVVEFSHDWRGRAFDVLKVSDKRRKHQVFVGPEGVRCSCEGETFLSTAKANQKAHEAGEETFPGYGCKHADAIVSLLNGGFFDL